MKNIAIVAGGFSGEAVISIRSAAVVEKNIDPAFFTPYKIVITEKEWYHETANGEKIAVDKNDFSLSLDGKKILFDAVFIVIHGTPGEDGRLQGYFDMLKIPYTTCDSVTSALTFNKAYCNKIVSTFHVVRISESVHLIKSQAYNLSQILEKINFPCFVKPNSGGSSIGMSKVHSEAELPAAIEKAFKEDDQILIENFIKGRELTCGVAKFDGEKTALPVTEVISKKDFFDYEAKYTSGMSEEITPAAISNEIAEQIQKTSKILYDLLNCFGMVRFDYILAEDSAELFFLEVNTVPGQSEASIVPQQVRANGWTVMDFYTRLINEALKR